MMFEPLLNGSLNEPLSQDQALLTVQSQVNRSLGLYFRHDNCYRCPYTLAGRVLAGDNVTYRVNSKLGWTLALIDSESEQVVTNASTEAADDMCSVHAPLGDRGLFALDVSASGCEVHAMQQPVNILLPLLWATVMLIVLALAHGLGSWAVDWFHSHSKRDLDETEDCETAAHDSRQKSNEKKRSRLQALDTFRGLTILLMIFVNDWEGQYWFFEHAVWNGLLVADVVFPWFMWIMGFSITLSLASQIKHGISTRSIVYHIVKRAFWLFLIGIVLNSLGGHNNVDRIRIPGVLQRFSICYLIVSTITLPAMLRKPSVENEGSWRRWFAEISNMLPQWLVSVGLLIGHTVVVFVLPVPGCPTGYLGPGGLHDGASVPAYCIGGATGYVDRLLLGEQHLYQNPTAKEIYKSAAFDPEGVLGVLTSCFTVFLGVNAGMIWYLYRSTKHRLAKWIVWGVFCGLIGAVLCLGSNEGGVIPINKNLWSISFVMVTACFAYFMLSLIYVLVDVLKWWSGSPFIYPGRNALAMYVGHTIAYNLFPFHWSYDGFDGYTPRLFEKLWGVACWIIVAIWLNAKGYFWKL